MLAVVSFVAFTASVALIAYLATRNEKLDSSAGYFLGGRSLTGPVIAGSLMLTNLSTEHLIGLNGTAFREGILVAAWETLAALAAVLMALFFLPRYLKSGITTIPQFLQDRYDFATRAITSILFLLLYVVALLPVVLYTGALALEGLFDVSGVLHVDKSTALWLMVWGVGLLGSAYAVFGGLKAVAVSDTINGIGLLVGGLLVPVFGLAYVGDGSIADGLSTVWNVNPEHFDIIGESDSTVPFSTIFTGMIIAQVFFWCTNQSIVQRTLGAKSLAEGQKGVLLTGFLKLLGPIIVVFPGVIAFHVFNGQLDDPDLAYPRLVNTVLPPYLVGFFAAVVVGAVLSTFNSALNSAATLFSADIYKGWLRQDASEQQMVRVGKACGALLAFGAMAVAPLMAGAPDGLYMLLQALNGIFNVPILTIVVVGLLSRNAPAVAAKIVLLTGPLLYVVLNFVLDPDLHFLHIMGFLGVCNVALMLIVGRFWPTQHPYEQTHSGHVDITPWRWRVPVSGAVAAICIGFYVLLAGGGARLAQPVESPIVTEQPVSGERASLGGRCPEATGDTATCR